MSLKTSNNEKSEWTQTALSAATTSVVGLLAWYVGRYQRQTADDLSHVPPLLLTSPWANELMLAIKLAKKAGSNMVEYLEAKGTIKESSIDLGIETKSGAEDLCTKIDVENEKLIMNGIRKMFPQHDIIGEETVGTGDIPPMNKDVPTWIIDPVDGTTNFSAGIHSLTCVSIAYCENNRPVVGVIYAPGTKELYLGVKGYGAYRNGMQIQQFPATSTKTLSTAIVCYEFGYAREKAHVDTILVGMSKVMHSRCRAIRQLGSGCLDLCLVASGRLDLVYAGLATEGWKPWDYAAGLIICQEAGCVMESIHQKAGDDFDLYSKSIICGVSRELVDEMRELLQSK
ncbi:inositol monophosphatase [Nitzschia inconspicua]|uniref:Inositol-1-monophosphatase n=1 Tax=Nitzschia inconspicua TaxID=303405 RepID=A0A9K3LQL5_9STRA|nr:inositol monophosphatase [Nitzschia inconspicua]